MNFHTGSLNFHISVSQGIIWKQFYLLLNLTALRTILLPSLELAKAY